MQDTLGELGRIEDSKFERLCAGYLRIAVPGMADLIATGINEQGKTIPCPVDGILHLAGPPETCVATAFTAIARGDLRGKWFGTNQKKGDIEKAADELQRWRKDSPNCACILYLATNRSLGRDVPLYRDAVQRGKDLSVDVTIIEASVLRDFLDLQPDGQYLRQVFLGIDVNRISVTLLQSIGVTSLRMHAKVYGFNSPRQVPAIERNAQTEILALLDTPDTVLVAVEGSSGVGKSTLLRQLGARLIEQGGVALWLPARLIEPGTPLTTVLTRALQQFQPSLPAGAGEEALRLCVAGGETLVLLVDDLNRLASPAQTLRCVEGWYTEIRPPLPAATSRRPPIQVIVPLWPGQRAAAGQEERVADQRWKTARITLFSKPEQRLLAAATSTTRQDRILAVFGALSGDPFLCGLAADEPGLTIGNRRDLIRGVIERALGEAAKEAANRVSEGATANDIIAALDRLIGVILDLQEPEPALAAIRRRMQERDVTLLIALAATEQMGSIVASGAEDRWQWKHDRLRDALVGRWLAKHAAVDPQLGAAKPDTWLRNPGLAEAWAMALAFMPASGERRAILDRLAERSPLALARLVRLNILQAQPERAIVLTGLERALNETEPAATAPYIGSPGDYLRFELSRITDPLVEQATRHVTPSRSVLEARIRNGDPAAILAELTSLTGRLGFVPWWEVESLEDALEDFQRSYAGTPSELGAFLAGVASDTTFAAALIAAGYLAWPELGPPLAGAWFALDHDHRIAIVACAAWAFSRTAGPHDALEAALRLTERIDGTTRRGENGMFPDDRDTTFSQPLRAFRRWPVPRTSIETWLRVAEDRPSLRRWLQFVLRSMDDPLAVDSHVRWLAQQQYGSWNPPWVPHDNSPAIRPETREHLWQLVANEADLAVQRIAYDCWRINMVPADSALLRALPMEHPLYNEALTARIAMADPSAATALIDRMHADPVVWCGSCGPLYGQPGVAEAFLALFGQALRTPLEWLDRAKALPPEAIRGIAIRYRATLLAQPDLWPFLWASGEPEAVELVSAAVATAGPKDLEFFALHARGPFPFHVTQDMLEPLTPHLQRFDAKDCRLFAELAIASGLDTWAEEHVPEAAVSSINRIHTKSGLTAALDAIAAEIPSGPRAVEHAVLAEGLIHRDGHVKELGPTLRRWLGADPGLQRFVTAAVVLQELGSGADHAWWLEIEPSDHEVLAVWSQVRWMLSYRLWHA